MEYLTTINKKVEGPQFKQHMFMLNVRLALNFLTLVLY